MPKYIPKWVQKRLTKLWKEFDSKEFTFDEAKNILKDDSRIVALVLSELKTTDWLESKKDPKDARKKIYSLIHTDVVEKMVEIKL